MSVFENDPESRHLLGVFITLVLLPTDVILNGYELLKRVQMSSHKE